MNADTNSRSHQQQVASEYLPSDAEVEPQGEQKWERTKRYIDARWGVVTDPRLTDFPKLLFTIVLDLALNPRLNDGPGVIGVSQYKLSQWLGKSIWTIRRANKALEECGHVWFSDAHQPGRWRMLVYHIETIDPKKMSIAQNRLELSGNGVSRERPNPGRDQKGRFKEGPGDYGASMPSDTGHPCPVTQGTGAPTNGHPCPVTLGTHAHQSKGKSASPQGTGAQRQRASVLRTNGHPCSDQRASMPSDAGQGCPILIETKGTKEIKRSKKGGTPLSNLADPEKIFWNGRHWWISQLYRQLKLIDEQIKESAGVARRELYADRNSLLVALGVKAAGTSRTGSAKSDPSPPLPLPPKEEWDGWVTKMREAVRGEAL